MDDWLKHHGIKGQKWGVRRTPEQLGHKPPIKEVLAKSLTRDTIVQDAIRSGEVSKTINREKQMRHTLSGHPPGRSYLYGDLDYAKDLVDELAGTGQALQGKDGSWNHRERVTSSYIIGAHVDEYGEVTESKQAIIVYSKTGSHIYPAQERRKSYEA